MKIENVQRVWCSPQKLWSLESRKAFWNSPSYWKQLLNNNQPPSLSPPSLSLSFMAQLQEVTTFPLCSYRFHSKFALCNSRFDSFKIIPAYSYLLYVRMLMKYLIICIQEVVNVINRFLFIYLPMVNIYGISISFPLNISDNNTKVT